MPEAAGGPRGIVDSSAARHGRLRRNAVGLHGVRLSGAPGAPLWIGCSSANRTLAGKLPWDGIVCRTRGLWRRVPRSLPSTKGAGGPAVRALSDSSPWACGHTATHGGTHSGAAIADIWRQGRCYRVDGPSGFTRAAENHGRTISER